MAQSDPLKTDLVRRAMEVARQAMFEFRPDTQTLHWADPDAAKTLLQFPNNADLADPNALLRQLEHNHVIERETVINTAREQSRSYSIEYPLHDEFGAHWIEERGSWMNFGDGDRLIGVLRLIDEQKERETTLNYLACYDELTGQLNRGQFKRILEDALEGIHAETRTGALFLVGIDDVGSINSDFGFDIADQVIVEVASRIERALGEDGTFGRVAGTKFGVLINENDSDTVLSVARRIMNAMRERVVLTRAGGIGVSVCIGAAPLNDQTPSSAAAMAQAEAAFDHARRKGKSSFESFSESTETISRRRKNTEISDIVLTALNDRRVYLAYQPIVPDVGTEPTKFECLIRMRSETGEEIPAPAFIPAAERLGLVHLLDRRVLELATQALLRVPDIALNVNLSWETVKDPLWAEGYLAHLRANARVCDRITVELTETQVMDSIEASIDFVSAIKELGCSFAIDDFGAGYTSFRNLKALDIDVLKIDGSFVTGVATSRENQLFVRTLLDLARNFGMKTVAEWVDNEADAILLKALGVDFLQGFYIGKPAARPEWDRPASADAAIAAEKALNRRA